MFKQYIAEKRPLEGLETIILDATGCVCVFGADGLLFVLFAVVKLWPGPMGTLGLPPYSPFKIQFTCLVCVN